MGLSEPLSSLHSPVIVFINPYHSYRHHHRPYAFSQRVFINLQGLSKSLAHKFRNGGGKSHI